MTQIELGGSFAALIIINGAMKRMALTTQGTPDRADGMMSAAGRTGEKDTEHADVELVNGEPSSRMGAHELRLWQLHQQHPSECKARLTSRVRTDGGATIEQYSLTATVDATFWTVLFRRFARQCNLRVASPFAYSDEELARIADHALSLWREGPDDGTSYPDYPWGWFRRVQDWENARGTAGDRWNHGDTQTPANRGGAERGGPADGHPGGGRGRGASRTAERKGDR